MGPYKLNPTMISGLRQDLRGCAVDIQLLEMR